MIYLLGVTVTVVVTEALPILHVYIPASKVETLIISSPFCVTLAVSVSGTLLPVGILEKEGVDKPDDTQGSKSVFPSMIVILEGGANAMDSSLDDITIIIIMHYLSHGVNIVGLKLTLSYMSMRICM